MSNPLVIQMAKRFGVDEAQVMSTLKATAFKGQVTDGQMTALMIVANQYGLNPFTKEIYAFPDKSNGIVPVVGIDGWSRIINEHPNFDGMDFAQSENHHQMDQEAKNCPDWIECRLFRKDRTHPTVVREYLDETYRPAFEKSGTNGSYKVTGPWQSHTKRMLRHKAMIQCARLAFGYVGIYDQDEAERIVERDMGPAVVVNHCDPELMNKWLAQVQAAGSRESLTQLWQDGIKEIKQTHDMAAYSAFKSAVESKGADLKALTQEMAA